MKLLSEWGQSEWGHSDWGQARGDASIGTTAPFPVSVTAEIESTRVKDWPLTARIDIAGELQTMAATVKGNAGQLSIVGEVVLAPFELIPVVSIAARTSDVNIVNFDSRLPHTALTVVLEAQPVGASVVAGTLLANNSDPRSLSDLG